MTWDIIYATDVHGNLLVYEYVLRAARELGIKNIIFGGDFTPKRAVIAFGRKMMLDPIHGTWYPYTEIFRQMGYWILHTKLSPTPASVNRAVRAMWDRFGQAQTGFAKGLAKMFGEFKANCRGFEIFIMPGNDDTPKTLEVLNEAESEGKLKQCHMRVHGLGDGWNLMGYSFISPTPFKFKYWEKPEDEIFRDLTGLAEGLDPARTILSTHVPPYNTSLDLLWDGRRHAGSKGVLKFIRSFRPALSLHGHIHEAPDMSGRFSQKIGKTLSINPGGSENEVRAMLVRLSDLKIKPLAVRFQFEPKEQA